MPLVMTDAEENISQEDKGIITIRIPNITSTNAIRAFLSFNEFELWAEIIFSQTASVQVILIRDT